MATRKAHETILALDGGCGIGRWCLHIQEHFGIRCEGVDLNLTSEQIVNAEKLDLKLIKGSILALPYADSTVDFYMSLGVFEHFEEGIAHPIREAFRVLKPGGMLLITVPFHSYLRRLLFPLWQLRRLATRLLDKDDLIFYAFFFRKSDARKELTNAGLKVDFIGPADTVGVGLWLDFPFLRDRKNQGIFPLNRLGRFVQAVFGFFSMYFTTWGILIRCRKPVVP